MTGYVRQSVADILPGEEVRAEPLNAEFNRLQMAFDGTTGHTHDGSAGGGPKLNLVNTVSGILPVANGGTGVGTLDGLKAALSLGTAAYTSLTDYATAAQGTRADGALQRSGGTMSGPIAMGGQKITGLAAPTADTDASTRKFVTDTLASVDTSAFSAHVNNLNNPHQVTKTQVGLGNVENLDRTGILADAALTGTPTAPTPAVTTNTTQIATTSFVQSAITNNVPVASVSDINNGTGNGFASAQVLGPVLNEMRFTVGDTLESMRITGTGSANWLECSGGILSKASYPDLFNTIGNSFADFIALSTITSANTEGFFEQGFLDNFVFVSQSDASGVNRVLYSTNNGMSLSIATISNGAQVTSIIADFIKFKGYYVALPSNMYTNGYGNGQTLYSTNGTTFTILNEPNHGNILGTASFATDDDIIIGIAANSLNMWSKTSPTVGFTNRGSILPENSRSTAYKKGLAYGNGVFVYIANSGKLWWSDTKGSTWNQAATNGNSISGKEILFINGKFYVISSTGVILTSSDGKNFIRFMSFGNTGDPQVQYIFSDGERLIFGDQNHNLYACADENKYLKLDISLQTQPRAREYKNAFRPSDGLSLMKPDGGTTVSRYKFAFDRLIEFQLPKLTSTLPRTKRYIRSKVV